MKTFRKFLAAAAVIIASLAPLGFTAEASGYYPGYACNYRDISGRCTLRSQTYPFSSMFNAYSVQKSPWDNREARKTDGEWYWYFDDSTGTYNRYRYQSGNKTHKYGWGNDTTTVEYEHTRYSCTGSNCGTNIRY